MIGYVKWTSRIYMKLVALELRYTISVGQPLWYAVNKPFVICRAVQIYHQFDLHWLLLQILDSKVLPLHFPQELQFLSLDLIPPPQVWEQ